MIKKFNEYIKEGLNQFLTGPSEDDVLNKLKELEPNDLLEKSLKIGLLTGVKLALKNGADNHYRFSDNLKTAAINNRLDVIKYLVEDYGNRYGKPINKREFNEALKWSVYFGFLDLVKYLVEQGADVLYEHNSILYYAVQRKYLEIIKYLVEHGAIITDEMIDYTTHVSNREIHAFLSKNKK